MKLVKAQILIITLLVLTIIAIITVSLVSLVNRDIQQVASNEQYEDAYNTAETQLKRVLENYSLPSTQLGTISTSLADYNCQEIQRDLNYRCSTTSSEFSDVPLFTEIQVEDTKEIENLVVYKDRTFDINLSGYLESIEFSWNKNAAIEFSLTYTDTNGDYKVIRDVYDHPIDGYVYDSYLSLSDNPLANPNIRHPFRFKEANTPNDDNTSVLITISEILTSNGLSGTPVSLGVTPRMDGELDSILLNARAIGGAFSLNQLRVFTAKTYNSQANNSTPVANIETKIPLHPQPDSVLDASFLTNGSIRN